jgi:inhibitor of cysteine peptidase
VRNEEFMTSAKKIKVGDIFEITLDDNPTTGFIWEPIISREVLEYLDTYSEINSSLVGSAARQHFRFKALSSGKTDLVFRQSRPWEKDNIREAIFSIQIDPV